MRQDFTRSVRLRIGIFGISLGTVWHRGCQVGSGWLGGPLEVLEMVPDERLTTEEILQIHIEIRDEHLITGWRRTHHGEGMTQP